MKNIARLTVLAGITVMLLSGAMIHAGGKTPQMVQEVQSTQPSPELKGIRDIYLAKDWDGTVDWLLGLSATDGAGEDITEAVTVDVSAVMTDTPGVYPVYYQVGNSYGNFVTVRADVTVAEARVIQRWIGSRQINRKEDRIIGAVNVYDAGVSFYPAMEENLRYMRPALVHLSHEGEDVRVLGSGFLMEISGGHIYVCTNRHVIEGYSSWEVYFYDGTMAQGQVVGVSREYDVGVLAVPCADIREGLLEELMTVHIDMDYWNRLEETQTQAGLLRLDDKGGIFHILTGNMIKKQTEFPWGNGEMQTEIRTGQEAGDSGSAIFDQYGNLISMVYGTSSDIGGERDWGIPLNAIVSCYEEIRDG